MPKKRLPSPSKLFTRAPKLVNRSRTLPDRTGIRRDEHVAAGGNANGLSAVKPSQGDDPNAVEVEPYVERVAAGDGSRNVAIQGAVGMQAKHKTVVVSHPF
jgi:hypothetical protein